ncbi:hypothetical protein [Legionella sp. WA2022007384]
MTIAQKLDRASGIFFFAGFLLSKLQYIPFPLAAAIFRFLSLGIYSLAYLCWFTACHLHPDHPEHYRKWYGFAQIKEQFLYSSIIGFTATIISVAAIFVPALFPPAAWLFLLGNILWSIGEYHKLKNPPPDENFSSTRQSAYLSYAKTSTVISLVAATAATFIFLFPPAAIPITIFSLLICVGLGALAFEFWLNCNFGQHEPDHANSYYEMTETLGPSVSEEHSNSKSPEPEPSCFSGFFSNPKQKSPEPTKSTVKVQEHKEEDSLKDNTLLYL